MRTCRMRWNMRDYRNKKRDMIIEGTKWQHERREKGFMLSVSLKETWINVFVSDSIMKYCTSWMEKGSLIRCRGEMRYDPKFRHDVLFAESIEDISEYDYYLYCGKKYRDRYKNQYYW